MLNKKGFTLIELLVVVAIVSLLAAIAVPNVINRIRRARMAKAEADIRGIENALAMLATDGGAPLSMLLTNAGGVLDLLYAEALNLQTGLNYLPWEPSGTEASDLLDRYSEAQNEYLNRGGWTPILAEIVKDAQNPDFAGIFKENVLESLSDVYIDKGIPKDPWGDPYVILVMPRGRINKIELLGLSTDPAMSDYGYGLNVNDRQVNLDYYIYSRGEDRLNDRGSGDDINNWDGDRAYAESYK